jgi:hypothetical protein
VEYPRVADKYDNLLHNGTRIVAQPNPVANPAAAGWIMRDARIAPSRAARQGRCILQTVGSTVRSGGSASTVRKP